VGAFGINGLQQGLGQPVEKANHITPRSMNWRDPIGHICVLQG
jgi:hypothetical protein